jgi:hypothetical protein
MSIRRTHFPGTCIQGVRIHGVRIHGMRIDRQIQGDCIDQGLSKLPVSRCSKTKLALTLVKFQHFVLSILSNEFQIVQRYMLVILCRPCLISLHSLHTPFNAFCIVASCNTCIQCRSSPLYSFSPPFKETPFYTHPLNSQLDLASTSVQRDDEIPVSITVRTFF